MSDETPSEESPEVAAPAPEAPVADATPPAEAAPAAEAPTSDVTTPDAPPVAAADPAPTAPEAAPVAAASAPAAAPARKGVFVPAWAGAIVLVLVVAAIGFGVGRWTADDSTSNSAAIANNGGIVPQLPIGNGNNGNGNTGNGNNGGQTTPQTPTTPATGTAFLGVATQNGTDGVQVITVGANSPAAKAGLKEGDVITAIDNTSTTTTTALRSAIQSHQSGDTVTVHYTRDGQATTVTVTLSTQSQ